MLDSGRWLLPVEASTLRREDDTVHRAWTVLIAVALLAPACGRMALLSPGPVSYDEELFAGKRLLAYTVPAPRSEEGPQDTVIGKVRTHRVREGETLLDLARYYDLGYNEIIEANPGIDPWLPPVGEAIVLPTAWVLPCCTFEGLVLNIPEMRLYFYRREARDPDLLIVVTHPVGIGHGARRTPRGTFHVRGKTENPTWIIPESIRRERIRDKGDMRRSIAGGDPDNPLGKYRLELSLPRYAIHGTNAPWGVGRRVSHGCARLYPEDIERLFPLVEVGTRVELAYQPVKVGTRGGSVYVEVHPDVYGYGPPAYESARATLKRQGLAARVDGQALRSSLADSRGIPLQVGLIGKRSRLPLSQAFCCDHR